MVLEIVKLNNGSYPKMFKMSLNLSVEFIIADAPDMVDITFVLPKHYNQYACKFAKPVLVTSKDLDIIYHEKTVNGCTLGNIVLIAKGHVCVSPRAKQPISAITCMLQGSIKGRQKPEQEEAWLYQGQYGLLQLDTHILEVWLAPGVYEIQYCEYSKNVLIDLEHSSALAAEWIKKMHNEATTLITRPGIIFPEMYVLHRALKQSTIHTELRQQWLFNKMKELLILSLEKQEDQEVPVWGHLALAETIRSYLHNNLCLANEITIAELAKAYHMSSITLRRFIVTHFKMSFTTYLLKIRMEKAQQLLQNTCDKPRIGDIAYEVGYVDPTAFAKKFKQYTGKTPKGYWTDFNMVHRLDNEPH